MLTIGDQEQKIWEYQWRAVDQTVEMLPKQDLYQALKQNAIILYY